MPLLADEMLNFHPLTVLREHDRVVIGRTDVDSYGVFPEEGAALLDELRAGRSVSEAADWYHRTYGEPLAIGDFVSTLRDLRFVADGPASPPVEVAPVPFQGLGRALFSPAAWVAFVLLVGAALAACLADPSVAPRPGNVFFTRYLAVVEVTLLVGQVPLVLVHELFHLLAGRRLGLRSSLHLGRRLHYVVFETSLDGLVSVPRRQRYLPMLAGVLADALVMSGLTVVAFATRGPDGAPSLLGSVCLALAFTTVPRILWQLYFFLRTDLYYLIATVLGCVDLHTTARQVVANRVNGLLGRSHRLVDEADWDPRDRRAARWYAPLMVAGYAAAIGTTVLVALPVMCGFLARLVDRLFLGHAASGADMADAAVLLVLTMSQPVLAALVAWRHRTAKESRQ